MPANSIHTVSSSSQAVEWESNSENKQVENRNWWNGQIIRYTEIILILEWVGIPTGTVKVYDFDENMNFSRKLSPNNLEKLQYKVLLSCLSLFISLILYFR